MSYPQGKPNHCTHCGQTHYEWPDPNYAVCWFCTWEEHQEEKHPKRRRLRFRWPFYLDRL